MHPLRVMTYNVRYFAHPTRGIASTVSGIRKIANGIASLSPPPDLVCMQEVETRSLRSRVASGPHEEATQLDRLMIELDRALEAKGSKVRFTAYYFPAHTYHLARGTNFYTTGLAVLAQNTFKVLGHNADKPFDITHRKRMVRLKQTRICAHLALEHTSGERFEVFNTHLSLPSFFTREFWTGKARMGFGKNQLEEAKLLADFVDHQRKSEHFVVAGDFNSLPGSPVDEYLRRERGFVEARRTVPLDGSVVPGEGRDTSGKPFATAGFMNLRMHIDHLYSSPSLEWLDMEDTHGFDARGSFSGLSDHVPLIARCRIASRPSTE